MTTSFWAALVLGDGPVVPVGCDLGGEGVADDTDDDGPVVPVGCGVGDTDDELGEADALVVGPAEDGGVPELVEQPARATAPATATARASDLFFRLVPVWQPKAPWAAVVC